MRIRCEIALAEAVAGHGIFVPVAPEADHTGTPDRTLLTLAGEGDRAALSTLYVRHRDRLRLLIRFRLGRALRRRLESEDVLQSAFARAVRRFATEPLDERRFIGWIVTAIENTLRDHGRRLAAKKRAGNEVDAATDLHDPVATLPSHDAQAAEDLVALHRALDRLSDRDRELILSTRIEGLTAAEAGARLGLTAATAQRAITRALLRLSRHMK